MTHAPRDPGVPPSPGISAPSILYAQRALGDCIFRGEAPLASHLLYPMVLNEAIPEDRARGIAAGHAWLPYAELMVIYADYGVSPGMRAGHGPCGDPPRPAGD